MKVVLCSNYLTHHQVPFCNSMYQKLGDDFKFISTQTMEAERTNAGWALGAQPPYEIKSYESEKNLQLSKSLINECDILLIGSADEALVSDRIRQNKIIFRTYERIYKKGRWRAVSPRGIYNIISHHTVNRNKNIYLLCSSAYTAGDFALLGAYKNKCFKWGYFPETKKYDIAELMQQKTNTKTEIIWCARFISWKHPEIPVEIMKRLKDEHIDAHLTLIGNGRLLEQTVCTASKYSLSDDITFINKLSPEDVRKAMEKSNIFLFTSDHNEGWGAVLNEAMNSGCAVVANHAIGAVPYLINDKENGLIYKNGDIDMAYRKIKMLAENKNMQTYMGKNAYHTISTQWNAENAAERLLNLANAALNGESLDIYPTGICSKDKFLSNHWYKEKKNA